ncbi:F-box only protein 30b isoform X2 [Stigmatopora argus]
MSICFMNMNTTQGSRRANECTINPSQTTQTAGFTQIQSSATFDKETTFKMADVHAHCMTCVHQRCTVKPQPGVSCHLTVCNLACGAVFHACKVEEHNILCPLARVPCLNSAYGCPAHVARRQISAHLPLCPAGVVCCTMEWNRRPVSCTDYSSYERLSRGVEEAEQLDMALALQDQRTLLESLKLIAVTPSIQASCFNSPDRIARVTELELSALVGLNSHTATERVPAGVDALTGPLYNKLYEATMETARSLAAALELVSGSKSPDGLAEGVKAEAAWQVGKLEGLARLQNRRTSDETSPLTNICLEIVARDDSPAPHHVPTSPGEGEPAWGKRKPRPSRPQTEEKAADTSDLQPYDNLANLGGMDLITAALIFCLESKDVRRISDTLRAEGGRVHSGTQTFPFPAAVLVTNTRVGDMASASACDHASPQMSWPSPFHTLRLSLVLGALKVEAGLYNYYNSRYQHMFPFVCAQSFRRDEFAWHFDNVHGDIHAGLNGWMEHRCPLALYGCTFSQRRFYPSAPGAKVVHDRHLRAFGVQPLPESRPSGHSPSDQLSRLPKEILRHVAGFLDGFSLCQLSLVSRTLRDVCACLLHNRGIVELRWERRPSSAGHVTWRVKHKVWRFSTAFSPVLRWGFADVPSMSNHLKTCQYNTVEQRTEPVPLPGLRHHVATLSLSKHHQNWGGFLVGE